MNIIKLKDVVMPGDDPIAEYFNNHLKGRYAYWVQMRYIVSFDHMRHEGYVACEEDINKLLPDCNGNLPKPYGAPALDVYDGRVLCYIDIVETDRINNTIEYRTKNQYVADKDISIDEVKKFRTWLATELLKMDQTELGESRDLLLSNTETHILKYYSNGMYDETIKILNEFGQQNISLIDKNINNTCGCEHTSNLSSLYNTSLSVCDPISIYKTNIYNHMVQMFSNIEFWNRWTPEFIWIFKKYIDNIIQINLPLITTLDQPFVDCGCIGSSEQSNLVEILKRLSLSLNYIACKDIVGHKNYINDALKDWSSKLYEIMEW